MSTIAAAIGRILIAVIFIVAGAQKLLYPASAEAMITGAGLPPGLAMPVGLFEVLAGLALAIGIMTRLAAILLAVFVALTTLFFHNRFTDPLQQAQALKNLAMIGGLLLVFAHSQMRWSWDSMRRERNSARAVRDVELRGNEAVHDAERRAHEAELRAARAEGRSEAARGTVAVDGRRTVADVDGDGVPETRRRRWWP